MTDTALIRWAADELMRIVRPLSDALEDADEAAELLKSVGWDISPATIDMDDLRAAVDIGQELQTVGEQLPALADIEEDPTPAIAIAVALASAIVKAQELADATPPGGFEQLWPTLAEDLPMELVGRYLEDYRPAAYAGLLLSGIAVETEVPPPQGATGRVPYVKRTIEWDRIGTVVSDPVQVLSEAFGWGTPAGLDEKVAQRLARGLRLFGLPARAITPQTSLLDLYYSANHQQRNTARAIELTLVDSLEFETAAEITARLIVLPVPSPASASGPPAGVVVAPSVAGTVQGSAAWPIAVSLEGRLGVDGGVRLELIPGTRSAVTVDGSTTIDARAAISLPPAAPRTLLGDPSSTSLKIRGEQLGIAVVGPVADPEVALSIGVQELLFTLDPGQADGFLARFLGKERQELALHGKLTWSSESGISFEGGAELKLRFPLDIKLGVIDIFVLTVEVGVDGQGFAVGLGVDGRLTIGPVAVNVENVGISMRAAAAETDEPKPALGSLAVGFGFKPPTGLGIGVAAGPVSGGGYVSFDLKAEQYAGALQLDVKVFELAVVGLLTTKMPDGSKGFSFLLIVAAEFQPIQLGYGFVLIGVGGLVGINRGVNVDYIRSGIKDGTLDSIRFPKDVAKNAPRIISDLRSSFPVVEGQYVFGPMVAIGWGSPAILRLELGLVLELPSPIRLLILGSVQLVLPDPDAAVIFIKLDILGVIDFEKGEVSFDGSLRDSRVLIFPLTGDMAMRLSFGSQPAFALSAGGFNPRFQPPPGFPKLDRMGIALSSAENPRLRLEAYFAVTANSLQLGSHMDLFVDADLGAIGHFTVDGHMGFDGLLQFDPFMFIVELGARLTLKRNGANFLAINLAMTLSGPSPWHAWGEARFEILGIERGISFDLTVGEPPPPVPLEPIDPLQMLIDALERRESWSAQTPQLGQRPIVKLRPIQPGDTEIVVHPLGSLTVRQKVLPLDLTIETFGHLPLAEGAHSSYTIKGATVGAQPAPTLTEVRDHFAPGDFFALSDEEKLTRPAFEPLKAGVSLGAVGMTAGIRAQANMGYRELIVDDPEQPAVESTTLRHLPPGVFTALANSGPAARSAVRSTGDARFANERPVVGVDDPSYAVASRTTMAAAPGTTAYPTFAEAEEARLAQPDPDALQVVGAEEAGL